MKNKSEKKVAPKLPRFKAPKNMTSKVYLDKKTKSQLRRELNRIINKYINTYLGDE